MNIFPRDNRHALRPGLGDFIPERRLLPFVYQLFLGLFEAPGVTY